MRILAIDQSLNSTGWAVVDTKRKKLLVCHGVIKPPKNEDYVSKINYITNELKTIFRQKECEYIVLEELKLYMNNRVETIRALYGLFVHLQCEFMRRNWLVVVADPNVWRAYNGIKGKNRQEKKQATLDFVNERFGIDVTEDEADAIGIGLYGVSLELE